MCPFTANLGEEQSSSMAVQLPAALLNAVQTLAREGKCFPEHSRAQHLEMLRR